MTTPAHVCSTDLVVDLLRSRLETMPAVAAVGFIQTSSVFSVWVGITENDLASRHAVYAVEDEVAERFTDLLFDFHVVPLEGGKRLGEYATTAHPVFQRAA